MGSMAQNRFVLELVVWTVRAVAMIAEDGTSLDNQTRLLFGLDASSIKVGVTYLTLVLI